MCHVAAHLLSVYGSRMKILVTGASGFIGSALMRRLAADGHQATASTERLASSTDWSAQLHGIETVVHCAARVHVMREQAMDPVALYREINVEGTLRLAQQAATAGIKRFIFISTIKVNGEETLPGRPFTAEDAPHPQDAYGISKHEAEVGLREIARMTGLEVVILRPPLVYGPGVKGNFRALMKLTARGIPLPVGAIRNQRSLLALENLLDVIGLCLTHPSAANATFLVADAIDLSTPELIRILASSQNKPARLISIPSSWLLSAARLLGKGDAARRLLGSLQLDTGKTRAALGWAPRVSIEDTLKSRI